MYTMEEDTPFDSGQIPCKCNIGWILDLVQSLLLEILWFADMADGLGVAGDWVTAERSVMLEHTAVEGEQLALDYTMVAVQTMVVLCTAAAV